MWSRPRRLLCAAFMAGAVDQHGPSRPAHPQRCESDGKDSITVRSRRRGRSHGCVVVGPGRSGTGVGGSWARWSMRSRSRPKSWKHSSTDCWAGLHLTSAMRGARRRRCSWGAIRAPWSARGCARGPDEPGQRVLHAGGLSLAVRDLGAGILGGDGEEVVGQPSPAESGVTGFLEQGVVAEEEGVIHGDALGAEDRQGVAEAGGLLQVAHPG